MDYYDEEEDYSMFSIIALRGFVPDNFVASRGPSFTKEQLEAIAPPLLPSHAEDICYPQPREDTRQVIEARIKAAYKLKYGDHNGS